MFPPLAVKRRSARAKINDLHFHDLRHEAISRLFEAGLTTPEVALRSGRSQLIACVTLCKPKADASCGTRAGWARSCDILATSSKILPRCCRGHLTLGPRLRNISLCMIQVGRVRHQSAGIWLEANKW